MKSLNLTMSFSVSCVPSPCGPPSTTKAKSPCPRFIATKACNRDFPTEDGSSSTSVPDTLPVAGIDTDWRSFRARLVASTSNASPSMDADDPWTHSLTAPEPGCLLLASPMYFTTAQQYFEHALILLTHHSASGSHGYILNKATEHRLAEFNQHSTIPNEFDPCPLYLGGDVETSQLGVVHRVPGLEGAQELMPGVYTGGDITALAAALASGKAQETDVKLVLGYCGWGPGQLESEVARGVWMVASASHHLLLSHTVQGAGEDVWHATLQMMGGDYAGLSAALKESFRADVMGVDVDTSSNNSVVGTMEGASESGASKPLSSKPSGQQQQPGHNFGSGI